MTANEGKPAPGSELLGQVVELAGLVGYQSGSVVSRAVVKKPTGTVTLFAFDAGEGLSPHSAPYDALVYIVEGRAEVTIAGEAMELSAGQMVIMPADKPHSVKAVERFKMLLVMIRS